MVLARANVTESQKSSGLMLVPVVPAKAGTQGFQSLAPELPACAGTTSLSVMRVF